MPEVNYANTAWLLAATAMVLFMTPGLAAFYSGMVRRKNVLSTTMHSFFAMGLVTVLWAVIGYTLAFSDGAGALKGWIGGLDFVFLRGVPGTIAPQFPDYGLPHGVYAMFQGMFAIITVGLITGAIAERMKFSAYVLFTGAWALLVYSPLAHWVWQPNGWLFNLGALDFAGGTVVHISSAAAALAAAIMLGKRKDLGTAEIHPHNLPLTVLGAGILWFGWFGFNAGSALEANGSAALAFMNTFLATACAVLSWTFGEWLFKGKPSMLGAASGAVAGLVAITPAAGNVGILGAFVIGSAAGLVCLWACNGLKKLLHADDALDVFGVHAVGGVLGALLTGVFNSPSLGGPGFPNNWFEMKPGYESILGQVWIQAQAVGVVFIWTAVVALVAFKIADIIVGLRPTEDVEREGLDINEHGEAAYHM
jgi:Amt family ammonium transporter